MQPALRSLIINGIVIIFTLIITDVNCMPEILKRLEANETTVTVVADPNNQIWLRPNHNSKQPDVLGLRPPKPQQNNDLQVIVEDEHRNLAPTFAPKDLSRDNNQNDQQLIGADTDPLRGSATASEVPQEDPGLNLEPKISFINPPWANGYWEMNQRDGHAIIEAANWRPPPQSRTYPNQR